FAVTELRKISCSGTYGVHLGNILCGCHQIWHRAKRVSLKIHIKSCHYNPHPAVCKIVANGYDLVIKKLSFVYAYHIATICQQSYCSSRGNGSRPYLI